MLTFDDGVWGELDLSAEQHDALDALTSPAPLRLDCGWWQLEVTCVQSSIPPDVRAWEYRAFAEWAWLADGEPIAQATRRLRTPLLIRNTESLLRLFELLSTEQPLPVPLGCASGRARARGAPFTLTFGEDQWGELELTAEQADALDALGQSPALSLGCGHWRLHVSDIEPYALPWACDWEYQAIIERLVDGEPPIRVVTLVRNPESLWRLSDLLLAASTAPLPLGRVYGGCAPVSPFILTFDGQGWGERELTAEQADALSTLQVNTYRAPFGTWKVSAANLGQDVRALGLDGYCLLVIEGPEFTDGEPVLRVATLARDPDSFRHLLKLLKWIAALTAQSGVSRPPLDIDAPACGAPYDADLGGWVDTARFYHDRALAEAHARALGAALDLPCVAVELPPSEKLCATRYIPGWYAVVLGDPHAAPLCDHLEQRCQREMAESEARMAQAGDLYHYYYAPYGFFTPLEYRLLVPRPECVCRTALGSSE